VIEINGVIVFVEHLVDLGIVVVYHEALPMDAFGCLVVVLKVQLVKQFLGPIDLFQGLVFFLEYGIDHR
jgi:hypothetical protein